MVIAEVTKQKIPRKTGVEPGTERDNSYSNQILIFFSAPLLTQDLSPVEDLLIQKEIDAIVDVLEEIPQPLALELVVKVATSQTLQDVLASRMKPLIIHFIGHGMREGKNTALVLEDAVGMTRTFSEAELEIALSNQKSSPCQLALLNACNSEKLAQAFVQAGVPHVIAVNAEDKILDGAARCFSRRLYQALFNQDSVADSFLKSRNAVKLNDNLKKLFNSQTFQQGVNFDEAFKFQLLPQDSHNQSLIIEPADSRSIIYHHWLNTNIPPEDRNFIGRKPEIHQVIKLLVDSDSHCLSLHGMGGIGKTALAYAIGRWLHERNRYRDGVWFISLRDTKSVGELIAKINQELELDSFALERKLRNSRRFLILDDLDELLKNEPEQLIEQLNLLIEQCRNLRLLLTARTALAGDLVDCHQQEVFSMKVSETKSIFKKYAPPAIQWGNEDLAADFERLVTFLDGYPLPIRLAASYMKENQCTLKMLCEDLDIEPLEILGSSSPEQRKERSLRVTLERSFERLSVQAQDIFPLLAFFPSGLSRDLARAIWGRSGNQVLMELLKFSMAEKSLTARDWRVTLPEPARTYSETKLQESRGIDYYAPQVLEFYHDNFCKKIIKLFVDGNSKQGREFLLQENSNLILFLEWGYSQEMSENQICRSARITASLSPYWRWIEPNQDPLMRLNTALTAAQRNQDSEGENLVNQAISAVASQGEFKDIQSLSQENDDLPSFEFEVITVNERGEEINREQKQASYYREDLGNDVALDLVAIPGGTFMMGSPKGEGYDSEKPQHQVTVQSFFLGKYPVTQAQWKAIAEQTDLQVSQDLKPEPSYFKEAYKGQDRWTRPVESISWDDAKEFCARLTKKTNRKYRLPTEAEWEYACRGVNSGQTPHRRETQGNADQESENLTLAEWNEKYCQPFHFGETITTDLANYRGTDWEMNDKVYPGNYGRGPKGEDREQTTPVGYFKVANEFGLYDMHGNVWEWCEDHWHDNYEDAPTDGSAWLSEDNKYKILRSGSFVNLPYLCRSASRDINDARGFNGLGFRVVCELPRTY